MPDTARHLDRLAGHEHARSIAAHSNHNLALTDLETLRPIAMNMPAGLSTPRAQHPLDHRSLGRHLDHTHHRLTIRAGPLLSHRKHDHRIPAGIRTEQTAVAAFHVKAVVSRPARLPAPSERGRHAVVSVTRDISAPS